MCARTPECVCVCVCVSVRACVRVSSLGVITGLLASAAGGGAEWQSWSDPAYNTALTALGASGNIGDRDSFRLRGEVLRCASVASEHQNTSTCQQHTNTPTHQHTSVPACWFVISQNTHKHTRAYSNTPAHP